MFGPWVFGVAIFTSLILTGSYFYKLTQYLVDGIPFSTVGYLFLLFTPNVIAKTLPMAMLLATLLAFSRLSRESEIVALKASGVSAVRMILSVLYFGIFVGIISFGFNELIVPGTSLKATNIQADIIKQLSSSRIRPESYPLYDNGKFVAQVSAKDFSATDNILRGVSLVAYNQEGNPTFVLLAKEIAYDDHNWHIRNGAKLLSADGRSFVHIIDNAWPQQVPQITFNPKDLVIKRLNDLDALSLIQIKNQLDRIGKDRYFDPSQKLNLEYGFWNKISLPLTAIAFGLLGAPIGIRGPRSNVTSGFWIAVLILFGYIILTNLMAVSAKGGVISAPVASFLPILLILASAAAIMYKKNL